MAVNFKSQVKKLSSPELVKINASVIKAKKPLPFDVYTKDGGIVKKLFNKGTIISNLDLQILSEQDISSVYIESEETSKLENYIKQPFKKESILESPVLFKNYSFAKEQYFQIDKNLLIPGTEINFSLYLLKDWNITPVFDSSDTNPKSISIEQLPQEGDLLIRKEDLPKYEDYLLSLEKSKEISEDKETLALITKESAKAHMKELLSDPRSGEKIKKMEKVVENIMVTLSDNPDSIYELLTLRGYDYYTYTHCINVGTLAIGLGIHIGLKKEEIFELGVGAMLHDIGKAEIPHEILNKQGKLTDYEYNFIKKHVILGYEILSQNKSISPKSLEAELHHHEKLSGRGYPYGLKGNEISLFGRITEIADCYDALTTRRPYKPPYTPFFALSIIVREKGDHDIALLKAFIKMLGKIK